MKLLIGYLGVNGYAVIVVLTTISGWFLLFDYGFPMAFQNYISAKRVNKSEYHGCFGRFTAIMLTVLIVNTIVVVPMAWYIVYRLILPGSDWRLLLCSMFIFNGTTVFSSVYRVFYAEHKGYFANIVPACASVVTVLIILALTKLPFLRVNRYFFAVVSVFGIPLIAVFLGYLMVLKFEIKYDLCFIKDLFMHSKYFFIFSVFAAATLQIDTLIISHYLTTRDLVAYNILTRIFGLIAFLYGAYVAAVMPVSAEMQRKGEYSQLNAIIRKNLLLGVLVTLICTGIFIWFKGWIFNFFSKEPLGVEIHVIFMMCVYQIVRVWTDTYAMLVQSMNKMRNFILFVFFQAVLSVTFQIVLVRYYALLGVLLGITLSYFLTVVWFLPYEYRCLEKRYAQ